ncbi:peptidoglycan bridge formation glycyltransferase FemA/FemB family protein [Candidatus Peregrinibacteria bacterium]|nr:peptidoglycan bridge formation glycyltransferase FemA/FemB family protein [Candidatus Peregrinibacteria bacterium]
MNILGHEKFEEFVKNHPSGTFFQSWTFGEFQEKIPYRGKSWCVIARSKATKQSIAATCLAIKMKLRFGKCWLWVPYGPLLVENSGEMAGDGRDGIFEDLARIAKEENAIFARIEPPTAAGFLPGEEFADLLKRWRIVASPQRFTPEYSLILDLEKTEDEILAQMKPKGRYNISVALRHGVFVEQFVHAHMKVQSHAADVKNRPRTEFDKFYTILQTTAQRDGFKIHPKSFYETLLATFGENSSLFLAELKQKGGQAKIIGGIIVIYYKDTATYYYGASDHHAYRNLMAPYLLQWEAIREAKRRGMKNYDFLGIAPPDQPNHPYAGITEFKKKFGGREVNYPPAFDIVYKPVLYRLHRFKNG